MRLEYGIAQLKFELDELERSLKGYDLDQSKEKLLEMMDKLDHIHKIVEKYENG